MIRLFKGGPLPGIGRVVCLLLMLLPALACDTRHSQRLEEARAEVAGADEQMKLAGDALSAGDQSQASEHFAAARDRFVTARDFYLQAQADASDDPDVLQEFAALCVRSEDYDLAATAYRRAADYDPENAELWFLAGQNFARVGTAMTQQALASLRRCLDRAAEAEDIELSTRAKVELAKLYLVLKMYELSREYYELAVAASPEEIDARIGLAGLYFREGQVLEAANTVDELALLAREDAVLLEKMLNFGYDGFQDARSYFADTAENHLAFAKLLTRLGRFREVLFALERVVELDDSNVIALNMLGSIALQAGEPDRALDAFKQSLDIDEDQPRTREALEALLSSSL